MSYLPITIVHVARTFFRVLSWEIDSVQPTPAGYPHRWHKIIDRIFGTCYSEYDIGRVFWPRGMLLYESLSDILIRNRTVPDRRISDLRLESTTPVGPALMD